MTHALDPIALRHVGKLTEPGRRLRRRIRNDLDARVQALVSELVSVTP